MSKGGFSMGQTAETSKRNAELRAMDAEKARPFERKR
jgi:hypothetical protein